MATTKRDPRRGQQYKHDMPEVLSSLVTLAGDGDGYTIFRIDTERVHFRGTTFVHAAREPGADAPRVIGIWRQ